MLELEARTLRRRGPVATRRWLPVPVPPMDVEQMQSADEADDPIPWRRMVELLNHPDPHADFAPGELVELFGK